MQPLAVHWSRSKPNFGDALSPLICARLTERPVVWAPVDQCDLVAIGSLLQRLKEGFWNKRVAVWGTGFIEAVPAHRSRHTFFAIRGRLSAEIIKNIDPQIALGDPGLLANLLLEDRPPPTKRYRCLIIPHYKDKGHPALHQAAGMQSYVEIADIFSPPMDLLEKIRAADMVLSSAMHGLIAADALGIPNAWIKLSDELRGGDFKFRDYYSAFGIDPVPIAISREVLISPHPGLDSYARPGLESLRQRLIESFPA